MKKRDRELLKKQQQILKQSRKNSYITMALAVAMLIVIMLKQFSVIDVIATEISIVVIMALITFTVFRSYKIRKDPNSKRMFIIVAVVASIVSFVSISHVLSEMGKDDKKSDKTEEVAKDKDKDKK